MPKLKMEIPRYDQAMIRFLHAVSNNFISQNPLLGNLSSMTSSHDGPIRNVRGDAPLDQKALEIKTISGLHHEDIRKTNLDRHTEFIFDIVEQIIRELTLYFFRGIDEITDATGRTVDAKGEPFSFDIFLDMLENMPIEFDDQGEPKMPTLIMHPNLFENVKRTKLTQEQKSRQAKIFANKKEEFYAKKRTRRLS